MPGGMAKSKVKKCGKDETGSVSKEEEGLCFGKNVGKGSNGEKL